MSNAIEMIAECMRRQIPTFHIRQDPPAYEQRPNLVVDNGDGDKMLALELKAQ